MQGVAGLSPDALKQGGSCLFPNQELSSVAPQCLVKTLDV